jgi:hypothetical protein
MDCGMRAEELHVGVRAAITDLAPTNGSPTVSAWADASLWHDCAPRAVREAVAAADQGSAWKAWRKHLQRRKNPISPRRLYRRGSILAWNLPAEPSTELAWLLKQLSPLHDRRSVAREELVEFAKRWFGERSSDDRQFSANGSHQVGLSNGETSHSNGRPALCHQVTRPAATTHQSALTAMESLAWLHLLVTRPVLFTAKLWWQVCSRLLELARRPAAHLESKPLVHQLSAGELPLTLAALLPELNTCRELSNSAATALTLGLGEILDGEGLPHCSYLDAFHSLVACWSRCRLLSCQLPSGCWNEEAEAQFPLAVREAIRLAPTVCGAETHAQRGSLTWLADVAADLDCDKPTRRLIRTVVGKRRARHARARKLRRLPSPAVHSEWAELAVLRADWSRRAAQMTVAYGERSVCVHVAADGEALFAGTWELELRAGGKVAAPVGSWREVCCVSDEDCDYLELQIELSESLRVQRQMLLAREEKYLFLADAILGQRTQELSYCGRVPISGQLTASAASETREILLEGRKARALILPLALPEWRADPRGGALAVANQALELRQSCLGRCMFNPLWIDLSRRRADKPFTWRQLTVAEERQNQPRDVAAGFRVQFGSRQWLVYRSLAEPANRTLLGKNLSTEFLLARFDRDGETSTIMEIE